MTEEWSSSNQQKTEPIPPSGSHDEGPHEDLRGEGALQPDAGADPAVSPGGRVEPGGEASRVSGVQGSSPEDFWVDDGAGASEMASAGAGGSSEQSGDVHEVPVPSETSAEGTSEALEPVDGVRTTAISPEGLADGETDNRMPPTTTF